MNSGIRCFKQNKRKAPIVEWDKPARCARVLLERLPTKPDKYIEIDKRKLNQICTLSEKQVNEEKCIPSATNDTDNQQVFDDVNEPVLKNFKKHPSNFSHEEIKNSSDTGKSKRKKVKTTIEAVKNDKINLIPIVLLEKISFENLRQTVITDPGIREQKITNHLDDSLVHTSSQNEIKTEKEEVKTFIELSAKGKSIVLDPELQNKQLCTKSEETDVIIKSKGDEQTHFEQKLFCSTSVERSVENCVNIQVISLNFEEKNKQKLEEKSSESIKNISLNIKQKSSSHSFSEENSPTTSKVPCKPKLRTKGKKLVLNNESSSKKAILNNSVHKDTVDVNKKLKNKQKTITGLLKDKDFHEKLLEKSHVKEKTQDTKNTIPKQESNHESFNLEEKCVSQNSSNKIDECNFPKVKSNSESKSYQLIKYPKIYIKRICANDLISNTNLFRKNNSLLEIKTKNKICKNNSAKEILLEDKSKQTCGCKLSESSDKKSFKRNFNQRKIFLSESGPSVDLIKKVDCISQNVTEHEKSTAVPEKLEANNPSLTQIKKLDTNNKSETTVINTGSNEKQSNFIQTDVPFEARLTSPTDENKFAKSNECINEKQTHYSPIKSDADDQQKSINVSLTNDFLEDQKLLNNCSIRIKSIRNKKSRRKQKYTIKNLQKSDLHHIKKRSIQNVVEANKLLSKQIMCEENNVDNNNTHKLLNSSGDSSRSSDDENFILSDSEKPTKEKFESSSTISETKLLPNQEYSEKSIVNKNLHSEKEFLNNLKLNNELFENKKNSESSSDLTRTEKSCEFKNLSIDSGNDDNIVENKLININDFEIFKEFCGVKTLNENLKISGEDCVFSEKSQKNEIFSEKKLVNEISNVSNNFVPQELDKSDICTVVNEKQDNMTKDELSIRKTKDQLMNMNEVFQSTRTNVLESSENSVKEQESFCEEMKSNELCDEQEFPNSFIESKIDNLSAPNHQESIMESNKFKESFIEQDLPNNSDNGMSLNEEKNRNKVSSEINVDEISNDSVIEEESVETDEVLDDEDFSNDSVKNKKMYRERVFDGNSDESHFDKHDNISAEPKITLMSTEKFEIQLEQEISNDSAMDDKLTDCKKIDVGNELIVSTEIFLENETLSDFCSEEKKLTIKDTSITEKESHSESNENLITSLERELSDNSYSSNKSYHSDKNTKVLSGFSNSFAENIPAADLIENLEKESKNCCVMNKKEEIRNFSVTESLIENIEVYAEEVLDDSEELKVKHEYDFSSQPTIEIIDVDEEFSIINGTQKSQKPEENMSEVINEVLNSIHRVVENEDEPPNRTELSENQLKKEVLKDIVANEHSYHKDDNNDHIPFNELKLAIRLESLISKNFLHQKTNQIENSIPHMVQEKSSESIINDDGEIHSFNKNVVLENCFTEIIEQSKRKSADMNVVEKIKSRLNNLKETCDLAFKNVTDIIRDCSSIIEKDLNELKKRRENENITNEKLLVINLEENKEVNKTDDSMYSEECFQDIQVLKQNEPSFNHDANSGEFLLNSKFSHDNFNGYNEYVIDHCSSNEISLEDVQVDFKDENLCEEKEQEEDEGEEKEDEDEDESEEEKEAEEYEGEEEKDAKHNSHVHQKSVASNLHFSKCKLKSLNDQAQNIINDHTYAELIYIQDSDDEIIDNEDSNNTWSPKRNLIREKLLDEEKSSSVAIPQFHETDFDDVAKTKDLNLNNKNRVEKDATISLKEICKKIAARINPVSSNENIVKDPVRVESHSNYCNNMSDLLYISGSDDEIGIVKNNLKVNQTQVTETFTSIELAKVKKFIQKEVVPEAEVFAKKSFIEPINFMEDTSSSGNNVYNVPMKCPKCDGIYFGYQRMKKHIVICGEEPNLSCPWCSRKLKYRQSLVKHFLKFHSDAVRPKDAHRIADELANEARTVSKNNKAMPALSTAGLSTLGHMPHFLKLYCSKCKILVDWAPNNTRICVDCFLPMSINCQNCERYNVQFNQVNFHIKGQCAPVRVSATLKCNICPFRTAQKYKLHDHMTKKHSIRVAIEKVEICEKGCNRKFKIRSARLRHERHCGKAPDRFCKFCPFKSKHRSAIKVHIQQHVLNGETDGADVEDIDNMQTSIEAQINGRNKSEYENRIRSRMSASCVSCKKNVKITDTTNLCDCGRGLIFTCNICNMKKSAYHPIRVHVIRRHLEKPFKCEICWRHYSYFPDYKHHISKCGREPEKQCNKCNFKTFSVKTMDSHKRKMHGNKSKLPTCQKCGRTFTLPRSLERHEEKYCGVEAKLSCEHCLFVTKSKFSLKRHLQSIHYKIFTNVRFECQNCLKEFSSLYSRDFHAKTCMVVWTEES